MDPYSSEGELVNIHTAFHQAQYQTVIDFDTSSFSPSNALAARLLQLRSHCAIRQYNAVLTSVSASEASSTPDLAAARLLATYGQEASSGSASTKTVAEAEKLAEAQGDNLGVQICIGTVLAAAGEYDKALALLKRHQGSLDAVALIVQVYLLQDRTDLAAKECRAARGFAQDALLVNLGEAWVGMREGGEKYQQSFYVFEELAQAPSTQAPQSLVAQAVSELHLGRWPEAETALQQAIGQDANSADALANQAVLNTILGKSEEADAAVKKLEGADKAHPMLEEIVKRKGAFEAAAAKYTPKFEP
ncbi:putative coatomer subunit epsilon [Elsinoe australis]|uniref:Coatomer subunit epsilon n=1 Tax=Elsinoe australis TaxID=40998 RepID=A0A4V6YAS6_9PEZI|nr:putative coatomer subunit epsilon [Elsinoe australis]